MENHFNKKVMYCTSLIPSTRETGAGRTLEFEASLLYIESSRLAKTLVRSCLKRKKGKCSQKQEWSHEVGLESGLAWHILSRCSTEPQPSPALYFQNFSFVCVFTDLVGGMGPKNEAD